MSAAAFDRRRALQGGLALCGGAALLPLGALAGAGCARKAGAPRGVPGARLVLVELSGGNDGLSAVVPFTDDAYYRARPTLKVAPERALRVNADRGLHPGLAALHRRFEAGELAIVEGAGYPDPVYSHFRSYEIWHTARAAGRASGDGWIGRLREAAFAGDPRDDLLVHVGRAMPYSLVCSSSPAVSFATPASFLWHGGEREQRLYESAADARAGGGSPSAEMLDRLRRTLSTAHTTSAAVQAATARYRPSVAYPDTEFARSLRVIAALLQSDMGTRVFSVTLGNFDSHGGTMRWVYEALYGTLSGGLDAFLADVAGTEAGERTLVLVYSEFGRRVAENVSGGTDHGAAGPMFLLGPRVRGGLYGAHPSVSDLDEDGNLVYTTDFRRVYAAVIEQWFGADSESVLDGDYSALPLIA